MADHLTEEEQIEAFKRWWREYWKSVVIPIVLVALGYYGWNVWQGQQAARAAAGSAKYEELAKALETSPGATPSEEQKAIAKVLAVDITNEFKGSLYADYGNMILARLAVDAGDYEAADSYLQAVMQGGANEAMKALAAARLARVKVARNDYDGAIDLVPAAAAGEFKSLYAEIRGDALAAQGKRDAAKTAYQEALESLPATQFNRRNLLQLKIDGAAVIAGDVRRSGVDATDEQGETPAGDDPKNATPAAPADGVENS